MHKAHCIRWLLRSEITLVHCQKAWLLICCNYTCCLVSVWLTTEDQLLQPLLSDDGPSADDLQQLDQRPARAAATDATATDKSWRDVQARQDSSDLTVQLGMVVLAS